MPELDAKAADVFAGKVVRKDLVRKVKVGANVPVYVLEYPSMPEKRRPELAPGRATKLITRY